MMSQTVCEFKLGVTSTTMFPLSWHGLPVPNQDSYKPYSIVKVCGDMQAKGYGFPSVVWTFASLSQDQLYQFMSLFDDPEDASVQVYIRTYTDVGGQRPAANFQAIMYRPVDGSGANLMPNTASHWANVQIRFAHLVEL